MKSHLIEQEALMISPENWVLDKATEQQLLLNYGTFKAAIVSFIEEQSAPLWEEFLNVVDEYDNLLLLDDEEYQETWMDMLELVIEEQETSSVSDADMTKQTVTGAAYSAEFTFSRYIYDNLNRLIKDSRQTETSKYDLKSD